jgi:glycosyltransferase involved in cell wall biosynthesis
VFLADRPGPAVSRDPFPMSCVVVSTYPPTACGIATFSAALCDGLSAVGVDVSVVAVGRHEAVPDPRVVARFDDDDPDATSRTEIVELLDRADLVIVQHEYGLFAGADGESVAGLLEAVSSPIIVVAHTVLARPTENQRQVLERVARAADVVVVMTDVGRLRLSAVFDVDPRKVAVIPHGAAVSADPGSVAAGRPVLLTWGLLGPGKGIEWAIDAMAMLDGVSPRPVYRIAGDTHPKVAAASGEAYRHMLEDRVAKAGVRSDVAFDAGYRGLEALGKMIAAATVVVLPYDSADQVTSGVLVDAVAAGRPVVATAFPHAEELLASGAGLIVPQRDPEALAAALRRVLTEDGLVERMSAEARRLAPSLAWPAVAARYAALGAALSDERGAVPA